jgi:hypothetical protein
MIASLVLACPTTRTPWTTLFFGHHGCGADFMRSMDVEQVSMFHASQLLVVYSMQPPHRAPQSRNGHNAGGVILCVQITMRLDTQWMDNPAICSYTGRLREAVQHTVGFCNLHEEGELLERLEKTLCVYAICQVPRYQG